MAGRHGVDIGVVVEAVVDAIERFIADAVWQRLLPALDPRGGVGAAGVLADEIGKPLALDRLLVEHSGAGLTDLLLDLVRLQLHFTAVAEQHGDAFEEDAKPVLAEIFLGQITRWNDPALAALNPGVTLPPAAITVVHRSDGSGTTYIWTDYLSKISDELVVTANGWISREACAASDRAENFYMLGSMGLASPIGLGHALVLGGGTMGVGIIAQMAYDPERDTAFEKLDAGHLSQRRSEPANHIDIEAGALPWLYRNPAYPPPAVACAAPTMR